MTRMPFVKPRLPQNETYLCTATDVDPDRTLYVTGVAPVDLSMGTVHHLVRKWMYYKCITVHIF